MAEIEGALTSMTVGPSADGSVHAAPQDRARLHLNLGGTLEALLARLQDVYDVEKRQAYISEIAALQQQYAPNKAEMGAEILSQYQSLWVARSNMFGRPSEDGPEAARARAIGVKTGCETASKQLELACGSAVCNRLCTPRNRMIGLGLVQPKF